MAAAVFQSNRYPLHYAYALAEPMSGTMVRILFARQAEDTDHTLDKVRTRSGHERRSSRPKIVITIEDRHHDWRSSSRSKIVIKGRGSSSRSKIVRGSFRLSTNDKIPRANCVLTAHGFSQLIAALIVAAFKRNHLSVNISWCMQMPFAITSISFLRSDYYNIDDFCGSWFSHNLIEIVAAVCIFVLKMFAGDQSRPMGKLSQR